MAAPTTSRELAHPSRAEIRLEDVLHALSDPQRLRIVREVAEVEAKWITCSRVSLPVSKSTLTHHFRVLRECGVLQQVYRGTAKMNRLRHEDLEALFPGLLDVVLRAAEGQAAREVPSGPGAAGAPSGPGSAGDGEV